MIQKNSRFRQTHSFTRIKYIFIAASALVVGGFFIPAHAASAEVLISEVSPDPDEGSEWVELYSESEEILDGWYIEEHTGGDLTGTSTFNTLSGTIPADGFVVIEGNGLNNTGDIVVLFDAEGDEVDRVAYGDADNAVADPDPDETIALIEDEWMIAPFPTKGFANALAVGGSVSADKETLIIDNEEIINITISDIRGIDPSSLIRYRSTLMKIEDEGDDIDDQESWSEIITDEDGEVAFGPEDGFMLSEISDLLTETGITTPFKTTFDMAGEYELSIEIYEVASGEVLLSLDPLFFTVESSEEEEEEIETPEEDIAPKRGGGIRFINREEDSQSEEPSAPEGEVLGESTENLLDGRTLTADEMRMVIIDVLEEVIVIQTQLLKR